MRKAVISAAALALLLCSVQLPAVAADSLNLPILKGCAAPARRCSLALPCVLRLQSVHGPTCYGCSAWAENKANIVQRASAHVRESTQAVQARRCVAHSLFHGSVHGF